jgi:tRNA-splicing ligase RtcB (3'-phosphate/5'-hydroxy nucleic acid ligase)
MERLNDKVVLFLPSTTIEPEALTQIENIACMPFTYKHVAVMPDCHVGKGATVGTVVATKGAVIPAAVGVDIGCGMIAVKTSLDRSSLTDLKTVREGIERRIPMSAGRFNTRVSQTAEPRIKDLQALAGPRDLNREFGTKAWELELGTLGGGNHFIEICLDETDRIWLTLHSGSRGVGNRIGTHYIRVAQRLMTEMGVRLPDRDLAYLPEGTAEFASYLRDLQWAQRFALLNREEMMDRLIAEVRSHVAGSASLELERINCHHNFTQVEHHFGEQVWVTRKGAIEANRQQKGMIPGSMGTASYIVRGLGNPLSFNSAPHGAGRRLSRTKARQRFTLADLRQSMQGIEFIAKPQFIDEIPGAYKDIDEVMANARDLVAIEHRLRQIVNVKGE